MKYKFLILILICISRSSASNYRNYPEIQEELKLKHKIYNLPENKLLIFNPIQFITWWRFDIVAKYMYAKFKERDIKSDWAKKVYTEHIHVWGNYREYDGSKNSLDDFLNTFDKTLNSIKRIGFKRSITKVRIDNRKYSCDGSHRIAACLLYNKPVICYYKSNIRKATYSTAMFFKRYDKYVKKGLDEKYLDSMAIQYCELKKNCSIVIVFPNIEKKHEEIRKILRKYGNIVYQKQIFLNENGVQNILYEIYGSKKYINNKIKPIKQRQKIYVYLFEEQKKDWKNSFNFEINNLDSIFLSKDYNHALTLSKTLFNKNSIQFLNANNLNSVISMYNRLNQYSQWLIKNNLDFDDFCIYENINLILNNNNKQIRFISHNNNHFENSNMNFNDIIFVNMNNRIISSDNHFDDIIFNPDNHFYYKNIKITKKFF